MAAGFNIAMDIVKTFPPKYWKKENYESTPYHERKVCYESNEFFKLCNEIEEAQDYYGVDYYETVNEIYRIQNPYSYARFMLRKHHMEINGEYFYEDRTFKIIPKRCVDLAVKYNCDGRRFGKDNCDYVFYTTVPQVYKRALLVVRVLYTDDENNYDDTYVECNNDSEFYIEYVVYFDNYN